jgi:hypothetical protein
LKAIVTIVRRPDVAFWIAANWPARGGWRAKASVARAMRHDRIVSSGGRNLSQSPAW